MDCSTANSADTNSKLNPTAITPLKADNKDDNTTTPSPSAQPHKKSKHSKQISKQSKPQPNQVNTAAAGDPELSTKYNKLKKKYRLLREEYSKVLDSWEQSGKSIKHLIQERKFLKKKLEVFFRSQHFLDEQLFSKQAPAQQPSTTSANSLPKPQQANQAQQINQLQQKAVPQPPTMQKTMIPTAQGVTTLPQPPQPQQSRPPQQMLPNNPMQQQMRPSQPMVVQQQQQQKLMQQQQQQQQQQPVGMQPQYMQGMGQQQIQQQQQQQQQYQQQMQHNQ